MLRQALDRNAGAGLLPLRRVVSVWPHGNRRVSGLEPVRSTAPDRGCGYRVDNRQSSLKSCWEGLRISPNGDLLESNRGRHAIRQIPRTGYHLTICLTRHRRQDRWWFPGGGGASARWGSD